MPLIKCPECQQEISDTAKSCPNCGYAIKQQEFYKNSKKVLKYIVIVAVILIIIFSATALIKNIMHNYRYNKNISLQSSAYNTAESGNVRTALEIADQIKNDYSLQNETKKCIVLSSYLANCKDELREEDSIYYYRFFGVSKSYSMIEYNFYNLPYLDDTAPDYPACVISGYDKSHNKHYLLFLYDEEVQNYTFLGGVQGLEIDYSLDKEYDFNGDNTESYYDIIRYNNTKKKNNSIKEIIELLETDTVNIDVSLKLNSFAENEDYRNIELLEPYHNYF